MLLTIDFSHVHEQIARFGGRPARAPTTRTLYPHFFSATKEALIVSRFHKGRVLDIQAEGADLSTSR